MISAVDFDDTQLVTLKLESGHCLRFQPDTGAQCNVIPVNLYKKATKDYSLERVTPLNTQLAAYGGSKLPVVGQSVYGVTTSIVNWIANLLTTTRSALSLGQKLA